MKRSYPFNTATQIGSLNDDVLTVLFSYLSHQDLCKISLVCRRWKSIAYQRIFWKEATPRLSLSTTRHADCTTIALGLAKRGVSHVIIQSLSRAKDLYVLFSKMSSTLKSISISRCVDDPTVLNILPPDLKNLRCLILNDISTSLSSTAFNHICVTLTGLEELECTHLHIPSTSYIPAIADNLKRLRHLKLNYSKHKISYDSLIALESLPLRYLSLRKCLNWKLHSYCILSKIFPQLEHLDISHCAFKADAHHPCSFKTLKSLRISYLGFYDVNYNDAAVHDRFTDLISEADNLIGLDIGSGIRSIAPSCIDGIVTKNPMLELLYCHSGLLSNAAVSRLLHGLPRLRYVSMELSDKCDVNLVKQFLHSHPGLRALRLIGHFGELTVQQLQELQQHPTVTLADSEADFDPNLFRVADKHEPSIFLPADSYSKKFL